MSWNDAESNASGTGGVPSPDSGVLADNEMVKANPGGTELVGTGDTNSDTVVDFGSKDIVTTGLMNSGTGTFRLGDAHDISSGGENVIFTNLVDNHHFSPTWIDNQTNESTSRFTVGIEQESSRELSKADVLINPTWISNPNQDLRIVKVTLEADVTITNVNASVKRDGKDFFSVKLGTLTADVETVIDLQNTVGNVPVDAFVGGNYEFSVSSADGDVRLKGNLTTGLPFFKVGFFDFIDDPVVQNRTNSTLGMNFVIDEDNMISDSPTKIPTQQSVKKYVDDSVTAQLQYKGGYDASTNTPNLETAPTGVITGYFYTVTVAGDFFSVPVLVGDALISEVDDPQVEGDWTILNRNLDAATIKALYESNPDTNAFTDAEKTKVSEITNTGSGVVMSTIERSKLSALPTLLQINNTNGYEISTDSSTKTVDEIAAAAGVQTKITNDGLGGNESNLPSTVVEFINHPDGEAILDQEDGVYSITLRIFTRPSVRDKRYLIEFIAQNGGSPISIFSRNLRFAKDLADEDVSISFSIPATAAIVGLPISVYMTPIGASAIIWGQTLSVIKNNAPIT